MEKIKDQFVFEISPANLEFMRVILNHTSLEASTLINYALDFYSKRVLADLEYIAASPSDLYEHKS